MCRHRVNAVSVGRFFIIHARFLLNLLNQGVVQDSLNLLNSEELKVKVYRCFEKMVKYPRYKSWLALKASDSGAEQILTL